MGYISKARIKSGRNQGQVVTVTDCWDDNTRPSDDQQSYAIVRFANGSEEEVNCNDLEWLGFIDL